MAPGELVWDQRTSSSTPAQRPWNTRTPSSESLSTVASMSSTSPNSSQPSLRKRHSNFLRKAERTTSPIPEVPPQRPPRNPARPNSILPNNFSRPSTANGGVKEWVKSWETPPVPGADDGPRARSGALSVKSKASSLGLAGVSTGPVEDVTPWELYPVPASNNPSIASPSTSASVGIPYQQQPSSSPRVSIHTKATGLVEDVTPWEMYPEPQAVTESTNTTTTKKESSQRSPSIFAPLRSKPPSIISNSSLQLTRMPTATGPTEEVTPWELEPPPPVVEAPAKKPPPVPSQQRMSLNMSKAQLEDVMPWELYPVPPVPNLNGKGSRSHRETTSTSSKPKSEFTLRRRRSTGSRPTKIRTNMHTQPPPSRASSRARTSRAISSNYTTGFGFPISASTPASIISHTSSIPYSEVQGGITQPSPAPSVHGTTSDLNAQQQKNSQFSTADRTILEELKRNIHARNAQFVQKGVGIHLTDGTVSAGKRHHPYSRRDVPYPRSYDRDVIDLDVWETLFCQDICESLTWHVFEEPPLKVLDIGCGTGTWILNCARTWRETQFVGLDIVPLHPDLQQVGNVDYASRITWVQANFLEGLPFPNDEFDFVHIKRIALGVPEDKWDALFDEVSRVMKPGAAFEMVEEDLFFPGKPIDQDDDDVELPSPLSCSSGSVLSSGRRSSIQMHHAIPERWDSGLSSTPTPASAFPKSLSRPASVELSRKASLSREAPSESKGHAGSYTPPGSPPGFIKMVAPHSRSSAKPTLYVRTTPNGTSGFPSTSPPKSHNSSLFNSSAVSLISSIAHGDSDNPLLRKRRSSVHLPLADSNASPNLDLSDPLVQPMSALSTSKHFNGPSSSQIPAPFLLRTPATAPSNPRDHSLLEYIYNETLSSRFINNTPLSLLTTYLEYHFKDARSHPPLMYTFPPVPVKTDPAFDSSTEDEEDDDNGLHPSLKENGRRKSTSSRKSAASSQRSAFSNDNGELLEGHRWLTMQGLLQASSPYISLDPSRPYAFSPSKKSNFTYAKSKDKSGRTRRQSRLPNKTLNIDLRTLNLHLALRAKEVIGCSESMWEWVLEVQKNLKKEKEAQRRSGARGPSLEIKLSNQSSQTSLKTGGAQDYKAMVQELTREDFNQLLLNFEMDMQDQASVSTALRERFKWNVIDSVPPQNRKIFDAACDKHDKWVHRETRAPSSPAIRPARNSLHAPSSIHVTAATPDTPQTRNGGAGQKPTRGRSNSHSILLHRSTNGSVDQAPPPPLPISSARSDASVHFALPSPAAAPQVPTQRLSRAMSVFVAWKQEETPYPTKS